MCVYWYFVEMVGVWDLGCCGDFVWCGDEYFV